MFERYRQPALLGALREDKGIAGQSIEETLREELERVAPPNRESIPSGGDLPLLEDTKRAVTLAAEEADSLQQVTIEPVHLVLGLMRVEACPAGKFLRQHGLDYDNLREHRGAPAG